MSSDTASAVPVTGLSLAQAERVPFLARLSTRMLILTVLFVMLAEIMIFVPSVTGMRLSWLRDRLNSAAAAAIIVDGLPQVKLPRSLEDSTLMATGTKAIALHKQDITRMIVVSEIPPHVNAQYDLAKGNFLTHAQDALATLFWGGEQVFSVRGPVGQSAMEIEVVMSDKALRDAMFLYCREVLTFSVIISLVTASLIFLVINRILIRPIGRMTASMQLFASDPSNSQAIMKPPAGHDELSLAAGHLSAMQMELQRTIRQQKNLADLGLAVSKINHDMRNILSSAQLMSDRLADQGDPVTRSLSSKLVRTLGRAIGYSSEVLAYGRSNETEPRLARVDLADLIEDVSEILGLNEETDIRFIQSVEPGLNIEADPEQLFRVLYNLCRNAQQALAAMPAVEKKIVVEARQVGQEVKIVVDDNGPGMPAKARENLFSAFRGSARAGGTGLGLAIARELVHAHHGDIRLDEKENPGTRFSIVLPHRWTSKRQAFSDFER